MKTEWFFAWYNLIFIVPFLLALLYVGIYAVSGLTFGDADVDHDMDVDGDAHFETDAHVDADAHIDADADADGHFETDADAEADAHVEAHGEAGAVAQGSLLAGMMSLLGVGRVPLSILLMVLLITWGVIGFVTNYVLYGKVSSEVVATLIAVCIAAVGSAICARAISSAMVRWFPTHETYVQRRHELLGAVGEAILPIDSVFGMAAVRDSYNDLFHIPCRVNADQPALEKGTKVRLVAYNGKQKIYYVTENKTAVASRTA